MEVPCPSDGMGKEEHTDYGAFIFQVISYLIKVVGNLQHTSGTVIMKW